MGPDGRDDFAGFVADLQSRLQQSAWLLTGDWASAEDLVQSCLAKVWRSWVRVSGTEDREAYVRRVLYNTFVSGWRRRWRGEQTTGAVPEVAVGDIASSVVLRRSLLEALSSLPLRQRAVVVLRFFEDLPEAEVADLMGCRLGTVKSLNAKAFARLRDQPGLHGLIEEVWP